MEEMKEGRERGRKSKERKEGNRKEGQMNE